MANVLASAVAWLAKTFRENVSTHVLYKRGDDWCEFDATLGRTPFVVEDQNGGTRVVWTDADILFQASLLVLGSSEPVLPQRGDRVNIDFGTQTVVHEVLAPGSTPEWSYSDQGRTRLRVHLKRIGVT